MLPDGSRPPQYYNSVASSHPILTEDPPPSAACDQYRQGLKASNYYNAEDSPDGAWVVVRKTAE